MSDLITHTPANPSPGGTVNICYENAARAGETITVSMDNGAGDPPIEHELALDSNDKGCFDFTIPASWITISVNAPDSAEHGIVLSSGGSGQ